MTDDTSANKPTNVPIVPPQPADAFRVVLNVTAHKPRLDVVLMDALRNQNRNLDLKILSRTAFKELFAKKHIRIKGQPARPSSTLAVGVTYVDIIGYQERETSDVSSSSP